MISTPKKEKKNEKKRRLLGRKGQLIRSVFSSLSLCVSRGKWRKNKSGRAICQDQTSPAGPHRPVGARLQA
jgi:hypothetical protein